MDLDKHPADINEWSLLKQYDYYFNYYSLKFKKVTVIFQNGKFYEFYGVETPTKKIGNVSEIVALTLLNIGYLHEHMCVGFQTNTKSKYLTKLLDNGWTVVQVDQETVKGDPKKKFRRGVTVIHSPETYIDDNIVPDNKYIVCCYVEYFTDPKFDPVVVGLSAIDITTGEIKIYETCNDKDDRDFAKSEITRFMQSHSPVYTIFYSENKIDNFENTINWDPKYSSPKYQKHLLEKLYPSHGLLGVYEYLGITHFTTAISSLTGLIQYCLDHNPAILNNLPYPTIYSSDEILMLANNAIEQLDLISQSKAKFASVFNLVNFTNTSMGHRLLKNRLLHPIVDQEEIRARYDYVEYFWDWEKYSSHLQKICDLEKVYRKLNNPSIQLLMTFVSSIYKVEKLLKTIDCDIGYVKGLSKLIRFLDERIDQSSDIFFRNSKLIEYNDIKKSCCEFFEGQKAQFEDKVNSPIEMNINLDGCVYEFKNAKYKLFSPGELIVVTDTKNIKYCTTEKIKKISKKYSNAYLEYDSEYKKTLALFISDLQQFDETIKNIIRTIAIIDVYVSSAKCAQQYNYSRPIVKDGPSFISAKQIRHPIIERLSASIYVPHDLVFGKGVNGMLLYGFNASGKSSLMKTLGINLILAQAGMFTASQSFKFAPFTNIQTRILSTDNLQKGLSSFAVEMIELRNILVRSNSSSLILGDEISRGTETVSGVAIVSAAIIGLLAKGAKFLFATHLHQLCEINEIKSSGEISICHLQVERRGDTLVYKRDLQPGCGDSLYGLEVARAMKLPEEFLATALQIRKKILKDEERSTRYNSEMFLDKCGVCGENADQVHHIRFQKDADENGFIGHFHKNHLRNLVGLCEKCHKKVHSDRLKIIAWEETSDGFKLVFE